MPLACRYEVRRYGPDAWEIVEIVAYCGEMVVARYWGPRAEIEARNHLAQRLSTLTG